MEHAGHGGHCGSPFNSNSLSASRPTRQQGLEPPMADPFPPLPPELASAEELTVRALALANGAAGLFDHEPAYEALFGQLARVLYRTGVHPILIGERGLGQSTILPNRAAGRRRTLHHAAKQAAYLPRLPPHEPGPEPPAAAGDPRGRRRLPRACALDRRLRLIARRRARPDEYGGSALSDCTRASEDHRPATPREYQSLVADDAEMRERFVGLEVPEPDMACATRWLSFYAAGLEQVHGVSIHPEAIRQSVMLSDGYILHERLPGKALRILSGSARMWRTSGPKPVGRTAGFRRAMWCGLPAGHRRARGDAPRRGRTGRLRRKPGPGDPRPAHAVHEVATELGLIKAGLTDPGKPASVILFVGQTGTGKTEMAKTLARFYSRSQRLRTYTLGNFIELHSVAANHRRATGLRRPRARGRT